MQRGDARLRWLACGVVLFGLMGLGGGVATSTPDHLWVDDDSGCGGHSPCFSSIQQAVDAASAGATIWIRPGSYEESVIITKPVNLIGEVGGEQVAVRSPDPRQPVIQIRGVGGLFQNLTITGGLQGLLVQSSDARLEFNQIIGNRDAGVLIKGGSPLLRRNEIGWTTGVCAEERPTCEGGDGIRVIGLEEGLLGPQIIGNTISYNYNWGIRVLGLEEGAAPENKHISIEQNLIFANGRGAVGGGIRIEGPLSAEVTYNQVVNNGGLASIQSYGPLKLIIQHNYIARHEGIGIAVVQGLEVEASYNELINNNRGFDFTSVARATVTHNLIRWNEDGLLIRRVQVRDGATRFIIQNNIIQGNSWSGIWLVEVPQGAEVEIHRNEIIDSGWGIWLVDVGGQVTMEKNNLEDNVQGVVVDRGHVVMNGNRITWNKSWGIALGENTLFYDGGDGHDVQCLSREIDWAGWDIRGADNEVHDNGEGDLCPPDYPWPEGFVQGG